SGLPVPTRPSGRQLPRGTGGASPLCPGAASLPPEIRTAVSLAESRSNGFHFADDGNRAIWEPRRVGEGVSPEGDPLSYGRGGGVRIGCGRAALHLDAMLRTSRSGAYAGPRGGRRVEGVMGGVHDAGAGAGTRVVPLAALEAFVERALGAAGVPP